MHKAVFLDRDGVINYERGEYNYKPEHILFNKGIIESLQYLSRKGYVFIVISNQGGIGKGLYSNDNVVNVNNIISNFLSENNIKILDFFYCPHHSSQTKCICGKPDSLLLEKAMAVYDINPDESYFIGDADRDMEAALKAGVTPVKIEPNDDLMNYIKLIK